jgi:hypothetical protein
MRKFPAHRTKPKNKLQYQLNKSAHKTEPLSFSKSKQIVWLPCGTAPEFNIPKMADHEINIVGILRPKAGKMDRVSLP